MNNGYIKILKYMNYLCSDVPVTCINFECKNDIFTTFQVMALRRIEHPDHLQKVLTSSQLWREVVTCFS